MPRTTPAAVSAIIEVDAAIDLTPSIETANALVTELCAASGYSAARLELIERWLAAHFYAIRDPRAASEGAGGVSASYQHKVDLHFNQTTYGQQAMLLDTAGNLAALQAMMAQGKGRVKAFWLGSSG
jgi:hypothetical protein